MAVSETTTEADQSSSISTPPSATTTDWSKVEIPFKNHEFQHYVNRSTLPKNKKPWRNLKQIVSTEQSLPWSEGAVTYGGIDAPPSFKPSKKYSDISGLSAVYTDPQTRMNYAFADEFKMIRKLPGDIVAGYLTLRKANTHLQ